ncbi:hypothetical protein M1432_00785 [Patescibacteria group bacterium]|nr:hypothetical protein [Patescibacteria group bacterium]
MDWLSTVYALGASVAVLLLFLATIRFLDFRSMRAVRCSYRPWFGFDRLTKRYFPVIIKIDGRAAEKRMKFRRVRFGSADEAVSKAQEIMRELRYIEDDERAADRKAEEAMVADLDIRSLIENAQRKR